MRVFLYDERPSVRADLRASIEHEMGLEVVGEAAASRDAARGIGRSRPDVLIVDVRQTDQGVDMCRDLLSRHSEVKCLVLTAFDDDGGLLDAVLTGAAGYVRERSSDDDLTGAIRGAAAGQSLIAPLLAGLRRGLGERAARAREVLTALSADELAVLEAIAEGLRNREIAEKLGRSERHIRRQVSALLVKLEARDRSQVLALIAALTAGPPGPR